MSVLNAQTLVTLLADCDLVKFAKVTPGAAAAQVLLEDARRFVMLSTAAATAVVCRPLARRHSRLSPRSLAPATA